ncbi:L-methionine/branched-chain amino acid transporter [Pectobacteriaceae bacterium CE70]|uniref:L-methionine/branched-chain amino acid transporter n=1 Tax=Serratia sp. (strain ATCC 39006) TaxID=104623 RepID=A0A2I5TP71_SERS3|nr:L-methionine/branched-chain amino acid transporter [Serratia sp. ATCC 39006]WJV63338.1 L-methionine/branched-chain amino acid transporter [Pectobacteriaceae bacterium C52]WJV67709.1 L-methionine/branched-chain amino acid transporter [Pectobacteriaceae bacterium CE70]WJY11652.1 L-methionine/branched-chain amino acid transporter [Pectobacteriaceae bacterium C80]AUH02042.1 L-methionine/branched-chain amino acid transporter [Serratia sp. ATCC 39006]AUH06364.1 L-methionine/branched-chain amino a
MCLSIPAVVNNRNTGWSVVSANGLKQEIGLVQGIGLLSTSLLGTGVFAVPALVAQSSHADSLWAWPLLILFVFPIAIAFASLGRHFPNAGGAAHFVTLAFGPRLARVTGWLFLSVIPIGLPAAMQIAAGFWQAAFGWGERGLLVVQLLTLGVIWLLGIRSAGSSATIQTIIAFLVVALVVAIWWRGDITPAQIPWPALDNISWPHTFNALAVMFWCFVGLEAFAHLATEFKSPERDFPRALLIGMLVAGVVYWGCTVAVLHFGAYGPGRAATASLPDIVVRLFGERALWIACIVGYLACFASVNIYTQGFSRLVWSQAPSSSPLAKLSAGQAPVNALSVVVLCCLVCCVLIYWLALPLDTLIVYANGIFVLIYLLCMLAGCRLLRGRSRVMAAIGSVLCGALLVVIGGKSLYALIMFGALWLFLPHKSTALLSE